MDTSTKKLTLGKLREIKVQLDMVKQMVEKDQPWDTIIDKLREQWRYIYDLKSLFKAFSISEKISQSKHDEAAEEARKPY